MTEGLEVVKGNVEAVKGNITDLSSNLDGVSNQVKTNANDVEVAQGHIKVMKEDIGSLQKVNHQDIIDKSIDKSIDSLKAKTIDPIEDKLNGLSSSFKDFKSTAYTGPTTVTTGIIININLSLSLLILFMK